MVKGASIPSQLDHEAHGLRDTEFDCQDTAKKWLQRQEKKRGKGKALGILAAKLGRAVYHLLAKKVAFDEARFWAS